MFSTIIMFMVLCAAFGVRTTVSGMIVLGVHMQLLKKHIYNRLYSSAITRLNNALSWAKGLTKMNMNTGKTLTLSGEQLMNPALMLAGLISQGFTIDKDSPISVLGGGSFNPALVIWQTVKHMTPEVQIETLVKRESVLSDYYLMLRNRGMKKDAINTAVDKARQFYIQTGKHDSGVMGAITGIASEQIADSEKTTRNQKTRGNSAPSQLTASVDSVYTVNDSPTIIVKVVKELASGDYRVHMVSGDVLPQGSKVMLSGVATSYTVRSVQGKTMTITAKSLAERVKESASVTTPVAASRSGRVAGMSSKSSATPVTSSKADVLAKVMALLATIED